MEYVLEMPNYFPFSKGHMSNEVEKLWHALVGEVDSAVEAGLVRAGRLRQSVLRSAFEGRL